jgi:hypothetical protein
LDTILTIAHGPAFAGAEARVLPASWRALKDDPYSQVGDLVVLYSNVPASYLGFLRTVGATAIPVLFPPKDSGNKHRHLLLSRALEAYDGYALLVDARDTCLQMDPRWVKSKKIYVSAETGIHDNSEWNAKDAARLRETLRPPCREDLGDEYIVNGGFIYGPVRDVMWFEFARYCFDARDGLGSDQAALNVLARQAGASVEIVRAHEWIFHAHWYDHEAAKLRVREEDGYVRRYDGLLYPILHQFDRVPSLKTKILQRYGL